MSGNDSTIKYEFLDSSKNFIYDARETGKTHTSFLYELQLFNAIKNGDIHGVKTALETYTDSGLIIGHMSDNQSREIHYWAVSTIAVSIHYAILGGLDESEAYQLSDKYIQEIDQLSSMDTCIDYLCQKAIELVTKVKVNTIPQEYSHLINNCIHLFTYIFMTVSKLKTLHRPYMCPGITFHMLSKKKPESPSINISCIKSWRNPEKCFHPGYL